MNPLKQAIIKEIEFYTKRNQENLKEKEGPSIKEEILNLREKKLEALTQCRNHDSEIVGKHMRRPTYLYTTDQVSLRVNQFNKAKAFHE